MAAAAQKLEAMRGLPPGTPAFTSACLMSVPPPDGAVQARDVPTHAPRGEPERAQPLMSGSGCRQHAGMLTV